MAMDGGTLLARCLAAQGVDRAFCVPGESYLALLNGLHGSEIDVITTRHEGGAAMMAEADGKMTGRPGIAMVTRGPGATNAASGVHVAQQDSTPMVLLVGQVAGDMKGRDAFQEVEYRDLFGGMAKWVDEVRDANRIPEIISHAFHVAMSGRPGPVVIALPEDMLTEQTAGQPAPKAEPEGPYCAPAQAEAVARLIDHAERPIVIAGGSRWDPAGIEALRRLAETRQLPVAVTFRRQNLFSCEHPNYAGDVGISANPKLLQRIRDADLIILAGGRLSEIPSQGFTLLSIPVPGQKIVHVHPGPEEIGRVYRPHLGINSVPGSFIAALNQIPSGRLFHELSASAHSEYAGWSKSPPAGVGKVTMSGTISHFRSQLGGSEIITNGAGNYAGWLHRYLRYRPGMQLAPTSGSMGYGLPAAIAASLRHRDREVFAFAGDGCFQMTAMEFGVAVEHGLKVRAIVCDNGIYGTIRMHQEREYPGRVQNTVMRNPDFAAWARSYGAAGFTVQADGEFADVLAEARSVDGPALIHLKLDARDIAPGRTIGA
jgi:acetolactate synthase I/II/III large subunit